MLGSEHQGYRNPIICIHIFVAHRDDFGVMSSHTNGKSSLCCLQAECLMQPGVLSGANLVYSAPTSGGKSAVAEILMLRRLITTGRPAMLVMPFVTLCAEKSAHWERLLKPLEKYVVQHLHSHVLLLLPLPLLVSVLLLHHLLLHINPLSNHSRSDIACV